MGVALEAGFDLAALLAFAVAFALLYLAKGIVAALLKFLDVGIGPWHPFHGIATKAENALIGELNGAIRGLDKRMAQFVSGLADAFTLIVGIPLLLAVALKDLLQYLWNTALTGFVHSVTNPIRADASAALAKVGTLAGTVADNLTKAESYAVAQAGSALSSAKSYASTWIDHAVSVLNANIDAARAAAESYADTAVAKLRSAEDAAVANAVGLAVEAKNAGINAAAHALETAEGYTDAAKGAAIAAAAGALTTAESYADAARNTALAATVGALNTAEQVAQADANAAQAGAEAAAAQASAVVTAAVDAVKSVAVDVQHDLGTIEGSFGALGVAALIASIPAIGTLVNALATETGLENEDCRQKVKGICATPTNAWSDLLAGLVATGFAFSLLELAEVADPLIVRLAPIVEAAA